MSATRAWTTAHAIVYTPFAQTPFLWMYVHVRTVGDPMAVVGSLRAALRSVDPRLTIASPRPMTDLISEASADPRFSALMITAFAAIAVILAAIGLYGVVSFGVVRRTREIAIQLALGASSSTVRWAVIRSALALSALGIAVGLLGAVWLGRFMEGLLFEVTPADPLTFAGVAIILMVVTLVAAAGTSCARPAHRSAPGAARHFNPELTYVGDGSSHVPGSRLRSSFVPGSPAVQRFRVPGLRVPVRRRLDLFDGDIRNPALGTLNP